MATNAERIVKTFTQLRAFCRDVALLLRTVDQYFSDRGWRPLAGTIAVANQSGSLDYPEWWITRDFFRRYRRDDAPFCEVFVALICDPFDDSGQPPALPQAIASAGCIDYRPAQSVDKDWDSSAWRWHLKHPNRRDDGSICVVEHWTNPWRTSQAIARLTSLAVPLDQIQTSEDLSHRLLGSAGCGNLRNARDWLANEFRIDWNALNRIHLPKNKDRNEAERGRRSVSC